MNSFSDISPKNSDEGSMPQDPQPPKIDCSDKDVTSMLFEMTDDETILTCHLSNDFEFNKIASLLYCLTNGTLNILIAESMLESTEDEKKKNKIVKSLTTWAQLRDIAQNTADQPAIRPTQVLVND